MSKRLRSAVVTVGLVLGAGIGFACADGSDDSELVDPDYTQVCMEDQTEIRASDDECGDDDGNGGRHGYHWVYLGRSHQAPPVGSKVISGTYSGTRPVGVGSRAASTGGFGTKVSTGGS